MSPRWCLPLVLLIAVPCSSALAADLAGKWRGTTVCPRGPVSFVVDIKERSGTFSYTETGPSGSDAAQFPVAIRTSTGWEGEWVYLERPGQSARDYQRFGSISGLLSADGTTLTVRGQGIGQCSEFQLSRNSGQAQSQARRPDPQRPDPPNPGGREPTESEMRAAVERVLALSGEISINSFKKLECQPARPKPEYLCRYRASVTYQSQSKELTQIFTQIFGSQKLPEEIAIAHFWYNKVTRRWIVQPPGQ